MKAINKEIKKTFELSNAEEVIKESKKLIKSLNELIEKIEEIKKIECSVYLKMEKFPGINIRYDSDEAIERIREYKDLLLKVDSNMESLVTQANNTKIFKFERSE